MKKDLQDRIDDYVLGRMSIEERRKFEEEIGLDKDKEEQLEFTRNVKNAIDSRQEKLRKMEEMRRRHSISADTSTDGCCSDVRTYAPAPRMKSSLKRIWLWASGIAAVLVVGYFIWSPLKHESDILDSSEMMRGDDEIFDVEIPVANDTILSRDTVKVIKEEYEATNE